MIEIFHLNCVKIVTPINKNVCGHCLLIKENDKLILIDTGIGLLDNLHPIERIGKQLIEIVGYHFDERQTALRQIEKLGLNPKNVTDCIISHLDNDHIGGISDFPKATVHLSIEELDNFNSDNPRYLKLPLAYNPTIKTYEKSDFEWFGFEARKIIANIETEIFLIPLFGHTLGHCGVALQKDNKWLFYVGDAYYMKIELTDIQHPVNELAKMRADDNNLRVATVDKIRKLVKKHPEIEVFAYHDIEEFENYETKNITPMLNEEIIEKFIAMAEANQHVECLEHFYADNAIIQDNHSPETRTKEKQIENEKKMLANITKMYSQCVRPYFVHNNYVVIKWIFRFEFKNNTFINIEEIAYQEWNNGQILREQFFFDPKQFLPQPLNNL